MAKCRMPPKEKQIVQQRLEHYHLERGIGSFVELARHTSPRVTSNQIRMMSLCEVVDPYCWPAVKQALDKMESAVP